MLKSGKLLFYRQYLAAASNLVHGMAKYRNAYTIFVLLRDKDRLLTWPDLKIKAFVSG